MKTLNIFHAQLEESAQRMSALKYSDLRWSNSALSKAASAVQQAATSILLLSSDIASIHAKCLSEDNKTKLSIQTAEVFIKSKEVAFAAEKATTLSLHTTILAAQLPVQTAPGSSGTPVSPEEMNQFRQTVPELISQVYEMASKMAALNGPLTDLSETIQNEKIVNNLISDLLVEDAGKLSSDLSRATSDAMAAITAYLDAFSGNIT